MLRAKDRIIETYTIDGYMVDVILRIDWNNIDGQEYEAWIYDDDYGVKLFMFGTPSLNVSIEAFIKTIEANIDEYIDLYVKEVAKNENPCSLS